MLNNKNFKKAFTLIELTIVVAIIFLLSDFALESLVNWKKRTEYDEATYQIVTFMKDARSYWATNYTVSWTWDAQWLYHVPKWWYWVEIINRWEWELQLTLFYNNNDNEFYDPGVSGDEMIKEWNSWKRVIFFNSMYWSWSNARWRIWHDISETWLFTWTIIFTNNWKSYISSWSWVNLLKNITFEFHLKYWNVDQYRKKRIIFERLQRIIRIQDYKKAKQTWVNSF